MTRYRKLEVGEEILKNNKHLKRLGRITGYLKEHYTEGCLAGKTGGNFWLFTGISLPDVSKYAKINYKEYLSSVRLEHAVRDLEETDLADWRDCIEPRFPQTVRHFPTCSGSGTECCRINTGRRSHQKRTVLLILLTA